MKKLVSVPRLLLALALIVAGLAIPVFAAGHTNVVQNLGLQLTYMTQSEAVTNPPNITAKFKKTAVATKDVIGWLGTATTNTFSAAAHLVRVRHFSADTNYTTIEVRDGTNIVDVSPLFADTTASERIDASVYNEVTQLGTGNQYEILHLTLTNAAPYNLVPFFRVQGPATLTYVSVKSGKVTLQADTISAPVVGGPGANASGTPALVTGSVTIIGSKTEVN